MGLPLTIALLLALAVFGWRMLRRARLKSRLRALPGGSLATAFPTETFADIDAHLARRRCACGGTLASKGESSNRRDSQLFRVVRVECQLCEKRDRLYFDVSRSYH